MCIQLIINIVFQNLDIKLSLLNCLRIYFLSLLGGGPGCSFFTDPRRGGGWEGGEGSQEPDPEPENDSVVDDIISLSLNFLVPFRNPKILERENYAVVIEYRPITGQFSFSFIYTKIFSHQLIGISFFKPTFFKGIIFISDQAKKFPDICLHTCLMCKYFCIVL